MQTRITGIDVARALAVFGMIIVNFKMVFGDQGNPDLNNFLNVLSGKAAATFVVLAGVGIALISNEALKKNDAEKLKKKQARLFRRAIVLFLIGLSYLSIWPADILHFYGVYLVIALILLKSSQKVLMISACILVVLYPLIMLCYNYDTGWDYDKMEYRDIWTVGGFIRNLFYNGFHPVVPWSAFMLVGLWFGKMELNRQAVVKKVMWGSLFTFLFVEVLSIFSVSFFSGGDPELKKELSYVLGTSPMPPLPLYMISGSSIALFIISSCIILARKFETSRTIITLRNTGQLALTFYVAHVVLGMGIIEAIDPEKMGDYTIHFSFIYALAFITICIISSVLIMKYKGSGPVEWVFRKLTG
ncbi:DUF1624 domain-containing protein [Fulvivirga sp. M361]|uniref:DUF418 domain-containing protein n=1 Tax=Fulvivirga sp. M361 TaxID=2594266 RepID=UPI0011798D8F|nr:heparan-alpha-glucosaminide N-acetyltransferase domain-containing protein [Fulvivirga sp. M361]TRX57726.1 DUF1624 domain-containing protein [Fulvivirga sp. M361]